MSTPPASTRAGRAALPACTALAATVAACLALLVAGPALGAAPGAHDQVHHALRYPWAGRFASAVSYARSRAGRVAFAVIDDRGRLHGFRAHQRHRSASLVKAIMLVAYLNRPGVRSRRLNGGDRALLHPMITRSDNNAASAVLRIVGDRGLARVARRVGMHDFATAPAWGNTQLAPGDQAMFFRRIDELVPRRHRAYARGLLSSIVPGQRWGMPPALPPGWRIFFKGGWRPVGSGWIVNQSALVQRGRRRVSISVLTDGNPSESYGHETIRGVASRLLRGLERY